MNHDDLIKADHSMQFAVGSLRDALKNASAVESLLLLEMIGEAAVLQRRIEGFHSAVTEDAKYKGQQLESKLEEFRRRHAAALAIAIEWHRERKQQNVGPAMALLGHSDDRMSGDACLRGHRGQADATDSP